MPKDVKYPRNCPQVNIKLSAEEGEMLDRAAARLDAPRSTVMRRALAVLDHLFDEWDRERAQAKNEAR